MRRDFFPPRGRGLDREPRRFFTFRRKNDSDFAQASLLLSISCSSLLIAMRIFQKRKRFGGRWGNRPSPPSVTIPPESKRFRLVLHIEKSVSCCSFSCSRKLLLSSDIYLQCPLILFHLIQTLVSSLFSPLLLSPSPSPSTPTLDPVNLALRLQ